MAMTIAYEASPRNSTAARGLTAWALTTGEAGMRTQVRGLAHAVADVVIEKTAPPRSLATALPRLIGPSRLARHFHPPWPDILISCGRRSVPFAAAIKAASGGRTLAAHIQDPRAFHDRFDLIVAMEHDRIEAGERILKAPTALHDVTPASLAAAGAAWRRRFEGLGHPLVGVAIGGDLRGRRFTLDDGRRLLDGLRRLRSATGASLAITPSRRTPPGVRDLFAQAFAGDPGVFLWDLQGENPYRGILALSDRLVVTTDSVSMVSEALATGRPVELLDLGFRRHVGFVQHLVDLGLARRFEGDPSPGPCRGPVDFTQVAAEALKDILSTRSSSPHPAPAPEADLARIRAV